MVTACIQYQYISNIHMCTKRLIADTIVQDRNYKYKYGATHLLSNQSASYTKCSKESVQQVERNAISASRK